VKRIAVVSTQDAALTTRRLEQARSRGDVVLVAPPELAEALECGAPASVWAAEIACNRAGPGTRGSAAAQAFEALRSLHGAPLDEILFPANAGLGQIACAEARTGGLRLAERLVVELQPGDGALADPLLPGATVEDRLLQGAAKLALRDADRVDGDPHAAASLEKAGWELARPLPPPAWRADAAPSVSAVVSYHNLGRFLSQCLASLRAQTVPVEIVVVDDGSRAEDAASLDGEAARDPHLRVVRQEQQGLAAARNHGIAAASHDLVLIVDADNVMRPRMVERLREALRLRPDAGWASSAFRSFDDASGKTLFNFGPVEGCDDVLLLRNVRSDACALYRRPALLKLGGFSSVIPVFEDWNLWLTAAEAGVEGVSVPEILFDYRERSDSMLRSFPELRRAHARFERLRLHPRLVSKHAESLARLAATEAIAETAYQRWLGRSERDDEIRTLAAELKSMGAHAQAVGERLQQAEEQLRMAEEQRRMAEERSRLAEHATREAQQSLDEMSRSGAVQIAELLRRASPSLHQALGKASQKLLRLVGSRR
jgi:GT2 family glycosyltransferase